MRFHFKHGFSRMYAVWMYALLMAFVSVAMFCGAVSWNFVKVIFYVGWGIFNEYFRQLRILIEENEHD